MKTILLIITFLSISSSLNAKSLEKKIANMFIVGFYGTAAPKGSKIIHDICDRGLGGVLLFDRHPSRHNRAKNISSFAQLKKLNYQLTHSCSHKPLIAIDQEGGKVQRLKSKNGFYGKYPKASSIVKRGKKKAERIYKKMAKELDLVGVNYNLAPVSDMGVNRKNVVIYRLGRSYGSDPETVAVYNKIFIDAMNGRGVLTALKHFPGHGSSLGDTHKGFVDVTKRWTPVELEPFEILIDADSADSIMVAHVFNRRIDPKYPASLSKKTVNGQLRKKMGYRGVVITDDLQMYAISKHYSLRNTIKLAINAGVDILLFGNQLDPKHEVSLTKLVSITRSLLAKGEISRRSIDQANIRIDQMRAKIGLGR